MPFDRPRTVEIEQRHLVVIHGIVSEIKNHVAQYNMEHPAHQEFVNVRLERLDDLLIDVLGLNRPYHPVMD